MFPNLDREWNFQGMCEIIPISCRLFIEFLSNGLRRPSHSFIGPENHRERCITDNGISSVMKVVAASVVNRAMKSEPRYVTEKSGFTNAIKIYCVSTVRVCTYCD